MNNTAIASSGNVTQNTSRVTVDCRQFGAAVWYFRVLIASFLFAASALTNFLNLLVFRQWKRKEPFLGFHIALSISGFVSALCGLVLVTDTPYSSSSTVRLIMGNATTRTLGTFNEYLLNAISIDRWIAVESHIFYRRYISTKLVILTIAGIFFFVTTQNVVLFSVLSQYWITAALCGIRSSNFAYGASWYRYYYGVFLTIFKYAVQIPTQARLCWLGIVLTKRKNRRVLDIQIILSRSHATVANKSRAEILDTIQIADPRLPSAKPCLLLWRSYMTTVLAGSAVVIVSLVCSLPITLWFYFGSARPDFMQILQYVTVLFQLRDISPFFIYLLFYPEYRRIFIEFSKRLSCSVNWDRAVGAGR